MSEVTKTFKHIARDIYIYMLPGFIFIFNLLYIDYLYFDSNTYLYLKANESLIYIVLISSYLIGHFSFGIFYLIIEKTNCERFFKKLLFKKDFKEDDLQLMNLFKSDISVFEFFIERHIHLSLFRWNFSAALIFSGFINSLFLITIKFSNNLLLVIIIQIIGSISIYILSLKTELDYCTKIETLSNQNLKD